MPPPRWKTPGAVALTRAAGSTLVALAFALPAFEAEAPGQPEEVTEAPDAGVLPEPSMVDTRASGSLTMKAGRPVPRRPESWQKLEPCDWRDAREVPLWGACYVRSADASPPCPPRLYEDLGRCYVAVARSPRPDTSIETGE